MSSKCKAMLLWTIWSTCKVVTASNEVVLVKRNVRDSFRVGEDGCTNDNSVCTSSATCQNDSGLCLCNKDSPNFLNRVVESSYQYSCIRSGSIRFQIGEC